jgi:ATP-dependent helicase HepA
LPALHTLLGGEVHLAPIAEECRASARAHFDRYAEVAERAERASTRVRQDALVLMAQSKARSRAVGLVADPDALKAETELSDSIARAVAHPVVRLSAVTCLVVSAQSWADYV